VSGGRSQIESRGLAAFGKVSTSNGVGRASTGTAHPRADREEIGEELEAVAVVQEHPVTTRQPSLEVQGDPALDVPPDLTLGPVPAGQRFGEGAEPQVEEDCSHLVCGKVKVAGSGHEAVRHQRRPTMTFPGGCEA
jgi:hypothetical protein